MAADAGAAQDARAFPAGTPPRRGRKNGDRPRLWLRPETGSDNHAAAQIREALSALRPAPVLIEAPPAMIADMTAIGAWLDMVRLDAILSLSALPPRPLIEAAAVRRVPMVLANADIGSWPRHRFWQRLMDGRPLGRFARVLVPDRAGRVQAIRRGALPGDVTVTGALTETRTPLPCSDAELAVQAQALGGRQGWFAAALPASEEAAVLAAHQTVLGLSHRTLLLLQPADPGRARDLAMRLEQAGLHAGLRSETDEPHADQQVFILDDPDEMGLWYRLAPVTLIGGTISGDDGSTRHPFEAAALGSAILHGPHLRQHGEAWHQLRRAGATRMVPHGQMLADHLLDVLAPEQAAELASRAWNVSTGGAAVAARIAQVAMEVAQSGRHPAAG